MNTTPDNVFSENSTTGNKDGNVPWTAILTAFEVVAVILLVVALYVLTCIVVYGTKTGRWKKSAGASSLDSGMIYVTCSIATATVVLEITWNVVLYQVPRMDNWSEWCEVFCDTAAFVRGMAIYTSYFFIWMRQRLIYTHPYVRDRIGRCMNRASLVFVVPFTSVFIGNQCMFVIPKKYENTLHGCALRNQDTSNPFASFKVRIALAASIFSSQIIIMLFTIYPVVRLRFRPGERDSNDVDARSESGRFTALARACHRIFTGGNDAVTSPIRRNARLTMICVITMVATDVVIVIVDNFLPRDTPMALRYSALEVDDIIRVFCMLATFGFSGRVLTLFCPKFERKKAHRPSVPLEIAQSQL